MMIKNELLVEEGTTTADDEIIIKIMVPVKIIYSHSNYFGKIMSKFNALKSVENYTGASDGERWIDRINLTMEVDEIDQKKSGRIFAMKLDDAAYDTWKKMKAEDQIDCEKIKQELRIVFGLGRFQSWKKIQELQDILPGDHVVVA